MNCSCFTQWLCILFYFIFFIFVWLNAACTASIVLISPITSCSILVVCKLGLCGKHPSRVTAACCVSSNITAAFPHRQHLLPSLCLWGWAPGGRPHHHHRPPTLPPLPPLPPPCPSAHASLESKLTDWLWKAILVRRVTGAVQVQHRKLSPHRAASTLRPRCDAFSLERTSPTFRSECCFWIVGSTSMACRLLPVTQFHSQVSVLSGYMVKLRTVAHSTQQAAYPHWLSHIKTAHHWLTVNTPETLWSNK